MSISDDERKKLLDEMLIICEREILPGLKEDLLHQLDRNLAGYKLVRNDNKNLLDTCCLFSSTARRLELHNNVSFKFCPFCGTKF